MRLYTLDIDDGDVSPPTQSGGLDIDSQTILGEVGTAKPIASSAPTIDPTITSDVDRVALALFELLNAPQFAPVPLSDTPSIGLDGWYGASRADRQLKLSDDEDVVEQVKPSFECVGTPQSHLREIVHSSRQVDHEFGNDLDYRVPAPTAAAPVWWIDTEDKHREPAAPDATVETAYGTVDLFDLEAGEDILGVDLENVGIVYKVPLEDDGVGDVRMWDSLGRDDPADWRQLFSKKLPTEGDRVVDNGRIRLMLDDRDGSVDAQEWDPDTEEWTDTGLADDQSADVELLDVDVLEIGMVRVRCQLTFDVAGEETILDAIVHSGRPRVQFTLAPSEDEAIPDSLENWLDPIASTSLVDPVAEKTLVSRSEVRK